MGSNIKTSIHAAVLKGDRFSRIIIIATGMAVSKNTSENQRQNSLHSIILNC